VNDLEDALSFQINHKSKRIERKRRNLEHVAELKHMSSYNVHRLIVK